MQNRCEEIKRDDEVLKLCLPRRTQPATPVVPHQSYAQAGSHPAPAFRIPKMPKVQATPQAPRGPKKPVSAEPQAVSPLPPTSMVGKKKCPA